ncbi:bifunctional diguanylate cyclase/phosphodiesterase [Couchioplanes caeruleus]|uniref:putative bifunctional diguanylate cyclase/phosphodiesterase n=1 Tax=Couchioplanes caeruleus TaxID=56438 RepID=UPI0020BF934B|nr:bifunctional diguanylate cyclase/phosphodiesterase [Couchioplanes caeruleus]UQU61977.1 bifunctional diguanylate cyclase/phosphodiesterase [Couchioplanes caeruleus]
MVGHIGGSLRTRVAGLVRRGGGTTAALAAVLLALAAYVLQGTAHTGRATDEQRHALAIDALFSEARTAIAMQEVNLRHYQVEPSVAVRQRFDQVSQVADAALTRVSSDGDSRVRVDALRLRDEQRAYRTLAVRLIDLISDGDPGHTPLDRLEVTPAFYTLQDDADRVARAYHEAAQQQVDALRRTQVRLLAGTAVGFAAGLALVAMIMRLVVGYQRRLVEQADESRHLALHDPLTGLPNRTLFAERLRDALADAQAGGHQMALMVVDLDGFKAVNDTLGHQAGDQVLREAGRRLGAGVGDAGIVSRLGGDEFAVLLPRVPGAAAATALAESLAGTLGRNFVLEDGPAAISGSLGVALGPLHGAGDDLFRHADAAMYRAKAGGGGVALYDATADTGTPDRMQLLAELRALLEDGDPAGQLELHYQPQVRLSDGTVTSVEALVRWNHPVRGLLPPAAFLTIAETSGLEVRLTGHLLTLAVHQAAAWRLAGRPLTVAVNVSPGCLIDPGFVPQVLDTVAGAGLPPSLLRLELTETSIMADPASTVRALGRIREQGVTVSVDDFGTGFSSLAQLRHVAADELKVDRMFIKDLGSDDSGRTPDAVMVRSAIDLGHNLGLSVVAEGVEDVAALLRLREMACDHAQGYVLSRPVPATELPAACDRAEAIARAAFAAPAAAAAGNATGAGRS